MLIGVQRQRDVDRLLSLVERSDGRDGFSVVMTGGGTLDHDFNALSQHDLKSGELQVGLPAALIVLVLVFGAVVAGLVPLLMAFVSIIVALGLCALVADAFSLSVFVVNMLTGMGLALGIDYSLFVVSRYREERARRTAGARRDRDIRRDREPRRPLQRDGVRDRAERDAAGALERDEEPRRGRDQRRDRLRHRRPDPPARPARADRRRREPAARALVRAAHGSGRGRTLLGRRRARGHTPARAVPRDVHGASDRARRPGGGLNLGASGVSTLPNRLESKRGYEALVRDFPQASASPALIAVSGTRAPRLRAAIARLRAQLARDPVFGRSDLRVTPAGDLAAIGVQVGGDKTGQPALDAIRRLRNVMIPSAFAGTNARVVVGGDTADNVDFIDAMNDWLPIVFAFVLGFSFVLLTVVFRSIVIAATSIVLNLLSVGAAYGLVILVFRHGIGSGLLGFQRVDAIEAWVPLFLFSVLFGLSMDYQVFLLSRIKERYDADGLDHRRDHVRRLVHRAHHHRRGPDHRGSLRRLRHGRSRHVPADGLRDRRRAADRRDDHPLGAPPGGDAAARGWNWYLPRWLEWLPRIQIEARAAQAPAS